MTAAAPRRPGAPRAAAAVQTLRVTSWGQIGWDPGDEGSPAMVVEQIAVADAEASAALQVAQARTGWQHPAIAPLLSAEVASSAGSGQTLVCRLAAPRGAALADLRTASGSSPWTQSQVAVLWRDLLQALRLGHTQGLVAGWLAPPHLVVSPPAGMGQAPLQLLHAGLPRLLEATGMAWSRASATAARASLLPDPVWVAPEVMAGQPPDAASDTYAAAACMVWTALGQPPHGTSPLAGLQRLADEWPAPALAEALHRHLPLLAPALLAALQPQPSARTGALDDLHAVCARLTAGLTETAVGETRVIAAWERGSPLIPLAAFVPAAPWTSRGQPVAPVQASPSPVAADPAAAADHARLRAVLDQLDTDRLRLVRDTAARRRRQQRAYGLALAALVLAAVAVVLTRQYQQRGASADNPDLPAKPLSKRTLPPRPQPRLLNAETAPAP